MCKARPFIVSIFLILLVKSPGAGQSSNTVNLGFELGNFTNWTGHTWVYSTSLFERNTPPVEGFVTRRHTIMKDTNAYDPNTGYGLKMVPPGYRYSARLGDGFTNTDAYFRCWQQSLRYTLNVDSSNALLVMKFACVLQFEPRHSTPVESRFCLTLYDKDNNVIPDCSNYDVYSTNTYVKGFNTYTPPGETRNPVRWRDWTTVGANLSRYIGQTITIEFLAADCNGRFHYGYAYFLAECRPLYIAERYCTDDTEAKLTAPIGFESYKWTNSSGSVLEATQNLRVLNPNEGEVYTCNMISATGCTVALQSVVNKYIPKADFNSFMVDCQSNTVQFSNLSATTHGNLQYKWDFGDGVTSSQKNPRHTFSTSGLHKMSLAINNPPSTCTDSITKTIESFSKPLVGIIGNSTYCPGEITWLKAYGAADFTWNNGSKSDSLTIAAPGGNYWLIGRSGNGQCVSDTIRRLVTEEPDWKFSTEGDTTLCKGQTLTLNVSGAYRYLWNTGDTLNYIVVRSPGIYSLTGSNLRGCTKIKTFNLVEYPIPVARISVSQSTLDIRHNQLTCSTPAQDDVQYTWNMGDNSIKTGTTVFHTYNVSNERLQYNITLIAKSIHNCAEKDEKIIDVVPFIPNVFSPNNDGINDLFMPDIDLHVFDRNGLTVYQGNTGWDGQYNRQPLPPDTYFYLVKYRDRNNDLQTKKGYVTLVRY